MTVRGKLILTLVLASQASTVFAQQSAAPLTTSRPRSTYDPAAKAGAPADTTSAVEKAFHAVNPQDKDYGAVLESARLAAIEETIQNVLWWADVVLLAGFSLSMAGNYWQHLRSEDRLRISAAIVAQLHNSHVASRAKALEAIAKHNQLADLYNAKCDEISKLGQQKEAGEVKRDRQEDTKLAHDLRSGADKGQVSEQIRSETEVEQQVRKQRKPSPREQNASQAAQEDDDLVSQLRAQLAAKDEQLAAKDVQIGAKDQKIQNLRTQVSRAHVSLTEEREGRPVRSA